MDRGRVIIVGAGVAGASAARALSADHEVIVVEQGAQAGAEASAQNAGMTRRLVTDPVERALACRSLALLPEWVEDGLPESALQRCGGLILAARPGARAEALAGAAADLRARGLRVDEPGEAELGGLAPALAGARAARAWWLPEDGLLDAHAVVQTGLAVARRRGARVLLGQRVTGLLVASGRVRGVRLPDGELHADAVLLASGAWGAWLAASAGLARALVPLARHLLHSDPHPLARLGHPYCWFDDEGLYLRPEGGGWLLSPCDEAPVAPPAGPGSAGPVSEEARALGVEKLARLAPAVAGARLSGGWTGLRTFAPDRRPWAGPDPELPGLGWLAGLGGAGVTCALALGELARATLDGSALPWLDRAALDPGRVVERVAIPAGAEQVLPASKV